PHDFNVSPVAQLSVTSTCASAPVTLDATGSHDPDGSIRLYEWDFDGNGTIDASGPSLAVVQHTYAAGPHRVKLGVTDNGGAFTVIARDFTVDGPDTLYVSASTGSPSGPGTRASPFSTLSAAIGSSAANGCPQVILVATGFYPEAPALRSH